ncbi:MAG: cobalamin-dependent protein, partial [bacterium]
MSTIILSRPASQSLKVVPTGLLYIASFIRSRARDIDVRILDLRAEPRSDERFAEDLLSCRPDLVGISGMIFETQEVLELARRVKRIVPSPRVILGGAVSTLDTVHLLDEGSVDFLCLGEGEETLLELAQALQSDKGPDAVKGLVFKCDGKVHYTG